MLTSKTPSGYELFLLRARLDRSRFYGRDLLAILHGCEARCVECGAPIWFVNLPCPECEGLRLTRHDNPIGITKCQK